MTKISIIDLNITPMECGVCGDNWEQPRSAPSYGIARYEDLAVPD